DPNRPITTELLSVTEVDDSGLYRCNINFDADDIDAAVNELESRYLAGEAAPYQRTWSVIARACAAFNAREMFPTTPDWVSIDHRRAIGFATGEMAAYIGATWDVMPDAKNFIEVVHRLSDTGALITHTTKGTSKDGVVAAWREHGILTVEGELISRVETFDEGDLDAAFARFHELHQLPTQLDNAATRTRVRVFDALNRRDIDALLAHTTADARYDDRRKVQRDEGRVRPDVVRAILEASRGMRMEAEPVAVRGSRLAVTHDTYRDAADPNRPIAVEHLTL